MIEMARTEIGNYFSPIDPGEKTAGDVPRRSVTDEEAGLLREIADGRLVIEIGTGLGISTRAMAETAVTVWTIDPDPWVQDNIWPDLPGNVCRMRKIPEPFRSMVFDMAFVDGEHSESAFRGDIAALRPLMRSGSEILVHDSNLPGVAAGFDLLEVVEDLKTGCAMLRCRMK